MRLVGIKTPLGTFAAYFSSRGLARLEFPSSHFERRAKISLSRCPGLSAPAPPPAVTQRWVRLTATALREALAGRTPGKMPALDWSGGTDFQRRVWTALRRIRPGQTRTYAQIAAAAGKPQAARAAGGACGANPIPVLVPCHRVTAANGGLGGFSAGLKWKRHLLAIEGVRC